jgi:hypothetical protein
MVLLTQFMPGPRKEGEIGNLQERVDIFEIPEVYTLAHLVEAARKVSLTNVRGIYPYLNAQITLEKIPIDTLVPTARYVLRNNLETQKQLHRQLLTFGIDTYRLTGNVAAARLIGNSGEQILVPPIIEVSEDDGSVNAITDGLHRITKAREDGETHMDVLKVKGSAVPLPVEPVGWDEVKVVDKVPPLSSKRKLRFSDSSEMLEWFGLTGERLGRVLSGVRKGDPIGYTMLFRNLGMEGIERAGEGEELREQCSACRVMVYDSRGVPVGTAQTQRLEGETPEVSAAIAVWDRFGLRTRSFKDFDSPIEIQVGEQAGGIPQVTYVYRLQSN